MIARLQLFFYVMLFALPFASFAQNFSISGKVLDANSKPIEFANVIILTENGAQFFKGSSTDNKGYFKLEDIPKALYNLRISYIGFEEFNQKIILTGNLDLKLVLLNETPESLGEVTVVSTKPTITRKPDRLIFNVENTALIEGSTLGVLKSTPGVIVSEGSINIKSAPATVYINNRKVQLTTNELIQLLESSPANSIKSVEVITNPPASYDADSGSVINIIMSKNFVTGYRGSVQTNYTQGVFPRYNAGTSHYFKNNKVNLNLNYNYTNKKINRDEDGTVNFLDESNQIDEIWKSEVNRNTRTETHNLNLNFDYYIDAKNTLSIASTGLYVPYYKYEIKNKTNIFDENLVFKESFTADNLSRDNKYNIGTDLIFRHNFNNSANLNFNLHYTIYDYDRDQNVFQDELIDDDSEFKTLANQYTNIITGKVDYGLPINETMNFDVGLKYSNVNTDSDINRFDIINGNQVLNVTNSNTFKYDEKVFAAYSNISKSWDKWDLNLGLRVEQTNIKGASETLSQVNAQEYLNWFPNASLSHQLFKDVSINGNYKRSISRPNYTDLNPFTFFINENTIVVGNPNLLPTYLNHFKVGIDFLKYFAIEAYYDNYDGAIQELPRQNNETNVIAFTPTNIDKTVDYGFDFLFNYYADNWGIYAATSFFNISEEVDFGNGFVKQNRWSNVIILSPNLSLLKDKSLTLNFSLFWINRSQQNLQTVEEQLVTSFSMSKSILNGKGIISLSAEDLFNKQDQSTSVNYLNQSSRSFVDADNRYIKLGFRYKFGNTKLNINERTTSAEERDRIKDLN